MDGEKIFVGIIFLVVICVMSVFGFLISTISSERMKTNIPTPSDTKLETIYLGAGLNIYEVTHGDKKRIYFGNSGAIQPFSP
jgi:hypothetical protein